LPVTIRKQNPEGLDESFGRFALPPQDPSNYRELIVTGGLTLF
jgi:hypothetical protein